MEERLAQLLREAAQSYSYPAAAYDFQRGSAVAYPTMRDLEKRIRDALLSSDLSRVKDGLSNVLYWGFYRAGYRDFRVGRFRNEVSSAQLDRARQLFRSLQGPGLQRIKELGLPEFSGVSFISKIRMFLDPVRYAVLDLKLMSLRAFPETTVLKEFSFGDRETQIRVSVPNERAYTQWCSQCAGMAGAYLSTGHAVDAERAIFHLIDSARTPEAVAILAAVSKYS